LGLTWENLSIKGKIRGELVVVEATEEEKEILYRRGWGFKAPDGQLFLPLVAAAYLVENSKLEVYKNNKPLTVSEIMSLATKINPTDILRYFVLKDLRSKGRIVKVEPKTPFMRLYPRGAEVGFEAAKILVYSVSEDEPLKQGELVKIIRYASRTRKTLLLAVIDDEMNISYYTAEQFHPEQIREVQLPRNKAVAELIHDRIIIWDGELADEFYKNGFWGHPIGVRKPKVTENYRKPLQLSLLEGIYLAEKGCIEVVDVESGNKIPPENLVKPLGEMRRKALVKLSVYRFWRDKGYIVKPASKYGVDFMFYKYGPGIDHAPYMCFTSSPDEEILPVELIRAGRIATTVRKTLVVSVKENNHIFHYRVKWYKP